VNQTHPDLGALLRGELTNAEALVAAAHAGDCPSCREELVALALGHGLLTRARATQGSVPVVPVAESLPPLVQREERGSRWRRAAWAVVAAAVVVAAAFGIEAVVSARPGPTGPPAAAAQTAALEPVQDALPGGHPVRGGAHGEVSMATDRQQVTRMQVRTQDLPQAARGEFYYVWLLDPATDKMLPLGQVTPGRPASFEVPESLVTAYSAIDISLESDDGDPGHSVTSVLRASYAAPATDTPSAAPSGDS
jgi:hypothetical protein